MASKFLNSFANIDEYNRYKESADFQRPNVAFIIDEDRVIVDNGLPLPPDTPVDPPVDPPVEGGVEEAWKTGDWTYLDGQPLTVNGKIKPLAFAGVQGLNSVILNSETSRRMFEESGVNYVEFGPDFYGKDLVGAFQNSSLEMTSLRIPPSVTGDCQLNDAFNSAHNIRKVEFITTRKIDTLQGFWGSYVRKIVMNSSEPCDVFYWYQGNPLHWIFVPDGSEDAWMSMEGADELLSAGVQFLPISTQDNPEYDENREPIEIYQDEYGALRWADPYGVVFRKIAEDNGGEFPGEGGHFYNTYVDFYREREEEWGTETDQILEVDSDRVTYHWQDGVLTVDINLYEDDGSPILDYTGVPIISEDGTPNFSFFRFNIDGDCAGGERVNNYWSDELRIG